MQKQFFKVGLKKMTPRIIGTKFQIESNHKKDKKVKKKIEIWEVNSFIHSLSLSWARYLHPLVSLSLSLIWFTIITFEINDLDFPLNFTFLTIKWSVDKVQMSSWRYLTILKIVPETYYLKRRWCACDSNPGWQDGRRRRIHWDMASPPPKTY